MNIRSVTQNDVANISSLVASLAHFYLKDKKSHLPEWFANTITTSEFSKRVDNPDYSNYLYEIEGGVVGYISMKSNNHLYHLFVSEKHQGKGIARKLWQYAIEKGVSNYYTLRSSLYAVPVYKKLGFIESGGPQEKEGICFQAMELRM